MKARRYRSRRRLRSELFPLAVMLSLPVMLAFAFPREALDFCPSSAPTPGMMHNAFVVLNPESESQLLRTARTSWQSESSSRRGFRANLLGCGEMAAGGQVGSSLGPAIRETVVPTVDYEGRLLPTGLAASAPATLEAASAPAVGPTFKKADLLKLK